MAVLVTFTTARKSQGIETFTFDTVAPVTSGIIPNAKSLLLPTTTSVASATMKKMEAPSDDKEPSIFEEANATTEAFPTNNHVSEIFCCKLLEIPAVKDDLQKPIAEFAEVTAGRKPTRAINTERIRLKWRWFRYIFCVIQDPYGKDEERKSKWYGIAKKKGFETELLEITGSNKPEIIVRADLAGIGEGLGNGMKALDGEYLIRTNISMEFTCPKHSQTTNVSHVIYFNGSDGHVNEY